MSIVNKGRSGWILESFGTLQTDRFGLSSATTTWRRYDAGVNTDPGSPVVFGNPHSLWGFLSCDKVSISHDAGPMWMAEANFFGVQGIPAAIFDLDLSTSEEPIETHPKFNDAVTNFATDANGATFDIGDGSFLGFQRRPIWDPALDIPTPRTITNPSWVGVHSYLAPGAVWRKTYVTATQPADISGLGKIEAPEGSPPTVEAGRNWLNTGLSWEQRGLTFQVRKEWRLSGRQGWNAVIYG